GCIESGKDSFAGGARWGHIYRPACRPHGYQSSVNSLAAIKKLVYEDKKIEMSELLNALSNNFEGHEALQRTLLEAPKWGNDDDYVDNMAKEFTAWVSEQITSQNGIDGMPYLPYREGVAMHWAFGVYIGALPDGKKAWQPTCDGSLSAMAGTDKKGPTAVFNSAIKIDATDTECTLLNLKIHPGSLKTRDGIKKFASLLKTYFDNGGYHCQFNILTKETLLDAKAHPENYRDLLVRVSGFSVYWVELPAGIQDEIIARTEHTL
ncbi:pyruvate formate lyase family protein, partial [Chloroflexota bacterium]